MKRAYSDIPEGQIHYQTAGEGDPLLLLHKTSMSSMEYSKVMPILARTYRVVAMDTLGYGESDKPPFDFNIEDYARSVVKFLGALGIRKTSIVGHHTGASIAVELAVAYPDLVDKLILVGCPYYEPQVREARLKDPAFGFEEIKEDGSHLIDIWQRYRAIMPSAKLENLQKTVLGYLMAGRKAHAGHQAVFRYEMGKRLPLIKSPVLLVTGGSQDIFHNRLEATRSLIPRCQTLVIEGGANLIPLEKPCEFTQAILDFLSNPRV